MFERTLSDVGLCLERRKPFDIPAERPNSNDSRDDRRLTFLNDMTGTGLFRLAIAQVQEFSSDTFFRLGETES